MAEKVIYVKIGNRLESIQLHSNSSSEDLKGTFNF